MSFINQRAQNEKLLKEVEALKKERMTLLSDLKVARLQLRRPPQDKAKEEEASATAQLEREAASLRREAEEARKEARKARAAASADAVRANRAAEELGRLREADKRTAEEIKVLQWPTLSPSLLLLVLLFSFVAAVSASISVHSLWSGLD